VRALAGTRIVCADDHVLVHNALRDILESAGATVVETVASWTEAVRAYGVHRPDAMLLDVSLPPDGNGLRAAEEILAAHPSAVIVCLSAASDLETVDAAITAGCSGFVSKGAQPSEIPDAIQLALQGELGFDKRTASQLIAASRRRHPTRLLSPREGEVLALAAEGLTNEAIADRLYLSRSTVAAALSDAYRKLDAPTRAQALLRARELGLI
jgi:two-component system invasion response regulator UvrY